jgi:hypothetical protein
MRAKYFYIILFFIAFQTLTAQRKMYQLDSIIHMERYPGINRIEKKEFKYLENDSLKEIVYYYLDTTKNKFIPYSSYRFYDINPLLYYYSVYYWDITQSKFKFSDSFKEATAINSAITFDSSFILNNGSWIFYKLRTSWHNSDFYSTNKSYDSVKSKYIDSNNYFYFIQKKYDAYGRDTFSWQKRESNVSDIIYKNVYDDSSRLSELYYAHKLNQYYLKEKLTYDSKGNLEKILFHYLPITNSSKVDSYTYYQFHQDIKLQDCNFRYYNEYYGQPFKNVPLSETLPWDTTGTHFEKRQFYYSKTKAYSQVNNIEKSKLTIYPNPSKGNLRHTNMEPLRLCFYALDGRKIEETRLEPNTDYRLRNLSHKLLLVEAYNLKGEKLFAEKLVLE